MSNGEWHRLGPPIPYVRDRETAAALVRSGDPRVAVALALASTPRSVYEHGLLGSQFDGHRRMLVAHQVAALAVVELCRFGYRIGWDSATAAATILLNELAQPAAYRYSADELRVHGEALARGLVGYGDAEPWAFP